MLAELEIEVQAGRVRQFTHPVLQLTGYNYSETCAFSKEWNDVNMRCRGLVLGPRGLVVARPFQKFFNYEELEETQKAFRPEEISRINRKEDGSLIIVFFYDGAWWTSTRGSFVSSQALLAQKLLDSNAEFYHYANRECTYLFELVGPNNINVCRHYPQDELILLGIIHTQSEYEYPQQGIVRHAQLFGCNYAKTYEWNDQLFELIKKDNDPNSEGIVVTMKSGLRFKLKSELYCQLHRVITGEWTPRRTMDIWMSRYKGNFQLDPTIPDEFYTDLKARLAEVDERWWLWLYDLVLLRREVHKLSLTVDPTIVRKTIAIELPAFRPYLTLWMQGNVLDEKAWETIAFELFCKKELN